VQKGLCGITHNPKNTLAAKVKEKKMANKRFCWGMLVMVLVFGMTVAGCGGDDKEKSLVYYDKNKRELYFRANRWENPTMGISGKNWGVGGGLIVSEFFTGTLKTNTNYTIRITGTLDVILAQLVVGFAQDSGNGDWMDVSSYTSRRNVQPGTISESFSIRTKSDVTIRTPVYVNFANEVNVLDGVSNGKVMATIKNFEMTITEY
jgi:hypothetical protein